MRARLLAVIALIALAMMAGCSSRPDAVQKDLDQASELLSKHKTSRARAIIDRAIKADPSRTQTYRTAWSLYKRNDLHSDAASSLESLIRAAKASKLDEKLSALELSEAHIMLGMTYQAARDLARAEQAYKAAVADLPNSPASLNALGYFYADEGIKLDQALKLTRRALSLAPEDGSIMDSVGWAQYKLGDHAAALQTLRTAVELSPDVAEIRYHLAAAYLKTGRKAAARIEMKKALLLDPHLPDSANITNTLSR